MMTASEAIKDLKAEFCRGDEDNCEQCGIHYAIEALEKQIPKKPFLERRGSVEFGGCYGVPFCPSCYEHEGRKERKNQLTWGQRFCDVCSQAIAWDWVEEE